MQKQLSLGCGVLLGALLLSACEDDDDDFTLLRAGLTALNAPVGRVVTGNAEVEISAGAMHVDVNIVGLDSVTHVQYIAAGNRCPTPGNDTNGDGFVDVREAMLAAGVALLALDSTLTMNEPSLTGDFPIGRAYDYAESGVFTTIENSLRPAPLNDFTASISSDEDFDPEGMPVLVLGALRNLPGSVATLSGFTAAETLPVACGLLVRVDD